LSSTTVVKSVTRKYTRAFVDKRYSGTLQKEGDLTSWADCQRCVRDVFIPGTYFSMSYEYSLMGFIFFKRQSQRSCSSHLQASVFIVTSALATVLHNEYANSIQCLSVDNIHIVNIINRFAL